LPRKHEEFIFMSAEKVTAPPDPDPAPQVIEASGEASAGIARQKRKKAAANFGRNNSILTNSPQENAAKKSILGG
jgi:hypothetical protein